MINLLKKNRDPLKQSTRVSRPQRKHKMLIKNNKNCQILTEARPIIGIKFERDIGIAPTLETSRTPEEMGE